MIKFLTPGMVIKHPDGEHYKIVYCWRNACDVLNVLNVRTMEASMMAASFIHTECVHIGNKLFLKHSCL